MIICQDCGLRFDVADQGRKKKIQCPGCGVVCTIPVAAAPMKAAPRAVAPSVVEPVDSPDDDAQYQFSDPELPVCPQCSKKLSPGAVACPACGFNQKTKAKAVREYEPIHREWDSDYTLQTRVFTLLCAEAIYLLTAAIALLGGMDLTGLIYFWSVFTALLCFILGTFEHITLMRDHKGRGKLVKQWRAFFVPLKPVTTDLFGFEGVTTGQWHNAGYLEWLVCIFLSCLGLIPAIIYWYNAIYKPQFHVALAMNHGHPEVYVYRGRSEDQMNDIADVVAKAGSMKRL